MNENNSLLSTREAAEISGFSSRFRERGFGSKLSVKRVITPVLSYIKRNG